MAHAAPHQPAKEQSKTLLFAAAGLPLGVPLEDMLRVVDSPPLLALPMAHPALRGVTPTLEGMSPVYDLEVLAHGVRTPRRPNPLVVLFPHTHGSVGLCVEKLGGLAELVDPLGAALQNRLLLALPHGLQPMVSGAATRGGQLFYFLSKDAFLDWVAHPRAPEG